MKNSLPQCLTLFIKMQLGNGSFERLLFLKTRKNIKMQTFFLHF